MYTGIITDISWERVLLTIRGQLTEHTEQLEDIPLYLIEREWPSYLQSKDSSENSAWRPKEEPDEEQAEESDEEENYEMTREDLIDAYVRYKMRIRNKITPHIPEYDDEKIYLLLRTNKFAQTYVLPTKIQEDLSFELTINVTNFRDRKQIPNGTFNISVLHDCMDSVLNIAIPVAEKAPEYGRSFLFNKDSECYSVTFASTTNELDPKFKLKSFLFGRKRERKFNAKRIVRETRDKLIKTAIQAYYNLLYYCVPKNGKRLLFATEARGRLQGNLQAIYNRLVERDLTKNYKIFMSFRQVAGGHGSAFSWIKLITYMALSDIVLIDDYAPLLNWLQIKPKTKIIQVWHAGVGFKSVGFCRFGANASPVLDNGHRKYSYAITGSESLRHVYSEVFGIEEENIIPTGLPRIDALMNPEKIATFKKEFYQRYPKLKEKKIILFAPTFRGTGQKTAHYPYERLDFDRLYEMCGQEYIFMFKMHPFIKIEAPIPEEYKDRIVDFTSFPDVNQLLQVTDILITDYSSVIYEYSLLKRPMIFYAYDKHAYSVIRGFHNDFDTFAPGKICTTFDEMVEAIQTKDFELEKVERFVDENFEYLDANSTDRFIEYFL